MIKTKNNMNYDGKLIEKWNKTRNQNKKCSQK